MEIEAGNERDAWDVVVRNDTIDEIIALVRDKTERNERFTSGWDFIRELEALKKQAAA